MEHRTSLREAVYAYVRTNYSVEPEYLWEKFPDYAVSRHKDNRKWFMLIMNVPKSKLRLSGDERIDILNVKINDPLLHDALLQQEGYLPGYHISRGNWISVLLDGTVDLKAVCHLIDISYTATASGKKKAALRAPKEWLIPANPKYYDILHAFDSTDVIEWKQSSSVKVGDIVFLYAASPVSAILYKCQVVEADIPYQYQDEHLTINRVMKIQMLRKYDPTSFTFEILKNEYGILAIRGPRNLPDRLSHQLNN